MANTVTLPDWPGAACCYRRAYQLLHHWAQAGDPKRDGVRMPRSSGGQSSSWIICTPEMQALIDALDEGDEEQIKGLLLLQS